MGSDDIRTSIRALNDDTASQEVRVVKGACPHDCPDTCALETTVKDGVAIRIQGAAAHPPTNGVLCTKVAKYLDRTYAPDRLLHPMKRAGRKGERQEYNDVRRVSHFHLPGVHASLTAGQHHVNDGRLAFLDGCPTFAQGRFELGRIFNPDAHAAEGLRQLFVIGDGDRRA